jgi:hypothetical protein
MFEKDTVHENNLKASSLKEDVSRTGIFYSASLQAAMYCCGFPLSHEILVDRFLGDYHPQ